MRTSYLLVRGRPMVGWCGVRRALATQLADSQANGEMPRDGITLVRLPRRLSRDIALGRASCPCGDDSHTHGRLPDWILFPGRAARRASRATGALGSYERNVGLCMGGDSE